MSTPIEDESDPSVLDSTGQLANSDEPIWVDGDWPPYPGSVRVPPEQMTVPPPT